MTISEKVSATFPDTEIRPAPERGSHQQQPVTLPDEVLVLLKSLADQVNRYAA